MISLLLNAVCVVSIMPREPMTPAIGQVQRAVLTGPSSSQVLSEVHPIENCRIIFKVKVKEGGFLLDTVGNIPNPPVGAFAFVWKDQRFGLLVYDPSKKTDSMSGGWHGLKSYNAFEAGKEWSIELEFGRSVTRLKVNGVMEAMVNVGFKLTPQALYAGDSPVDDSTGTHLAASGEVELSAFETIPDPALSPRARLDMEEDAFDSLPLALQLGPAKANAPKGLPGGISVVPSQPGKEGIPPGARIVQILEVTAGSRKHFNSPITITATLAAENKDQALALRAAVYDQESKKWTLVPTRVDLAKGFVTCRTTHLCKLGFFVWRRWYRDIVETDHFRIAFKSERLKVEEKRGDLAWGLARAVEPALAGGYPKGGPDWIPLFIQDLAEALEWSYQSYKREGFTLPSDSWKTDVLVEGSDHALNLVGGVDPFREKLTGMIWIPEAVSSESLLRRTAAHELFHCIQNEYFGIAGMNLRPWFIEATAEYAAVKVGMKGKLPLFPTKTRWFEAPLLQKDDVHEYDSAQFLEYLNQNGLKFKPLFEHVAKDRTGQDDWGTYGAQFFQGDQDLNTHKLTTVSIAAWARSLGKDLAALHRSFLKRSLLSPEPWTEHGADQSLMTQIGSSPCRLDSTKPSKTQMINVAPYLAGRIWPVLPPLKQSQAEITISLAKPLVDGLRVDVILGNADKPTTGGGTLLATFDQKLKVAKATATVRQGQALYALATNTSTKGLSVTLNASMGPTLSIQPGAVDDGHTATSYSFVVISEKLPASLKTVKLELNLGHDSMVKGKTVKVVKGSARLVVTHVFGRLGVFTLKGRALDGKHEIAVGEATVKITRNNPIKKDDVPKPTEESSEPQKEPTKPPSGGAAGALSLVGVSTEQFPAKGIEGLYEKSEPAKFSIGQSSGSISVKWEEFYPGRARESKSAAVTAGWGGFPSELSPSVPTKMTLSVEGQGGEVRAFLLARASEGDVKSDTLIYSPPENSLRVPANSTATVKREVILIPYVNPTAPYYVVEITIIGPRSNTASIKAVYKRK